MSTYEPSVELVSTNKVRVPLAVWAFVAVAAFIAIFLVQENGHILSAEAATYLHEVTHDGRHALGVPCH